MSNFALEGIKLKEILKRTVAIIMIVTVVALAEQQLGFTERLVQYSGKIIRRFSHSPDIIPIKIKDSSERYAF